MAALDFPANPTDGQIYGNYVYSTSTGAWLARSVSQQVAVTSPTAPSNPVNGTLWYNTNDGSTYIYYYDGDSSQWVQAKSDATLSSTLGNRVTALEAYPSGLVPMIPTSAAFVAGSGSANSLGEVSFSGCTSVELRGVFTPDYRNYRVICDFNKSGSNAADQIYLKFISGTTVNGTGWGGSGFSAWGTGWASTAAGDYADNSLRMNQIYYADGSGHNFVADIFKPRIAERSSIVGMSKGVTSTVHTYAIFGGQHGEIAAYDGLSFGITASNVAGKIQVFGYND